MSREKFKLAGQFVRFISAIDHADREFFRHELFATSGNLFGLAGLSMIVACIISLSKAESGPLGRNAQ